MTDFKQRTLEEVRKARKTIKDDIARLEAELKHLDQVEDAVRKLGRGALESTEQLVRRGRSAVRSAGSSARKATGRKPAARKGTGKRGRPPGSGGRQQQVLKVVKANPGLRNKDVAEKCKMSQSQASSTLNNLAKQGLLKKQGSGWHAA